MAPLGLEEAQLELGQLPDDAGRDFCLDVWQNQGLKHIETSRTEHQKWLNMKSFSLETTFQVVLCGMHLFAVFDLCLSVLHIVLQHQAKENLKSKSTCNTHNIGSQYLIGCLMNFQLFANFQSYKSTFPMFIFGFKADPKNQDIFWTT